MSDVAHMDCFSCTNQTISKDDNILCLHCIYFGQIECDGLLVPLNSFPFL